MMKKVIAVHKLFITVLAALVLLASVGTVAAFAMTPEEEAAVRDFDKWLDNATIKSAGRISFGSDPGSSGGSTVTANPPAGKTDTEANAKETIALTNRERVNAGLDELAIDEEMMELAAVRAKELAEKWSHERLDGTRISLEYHFAEIISSRATPEMAVNGWMASAKGHREVILTGEYRSIGAGCYQADDGSVYWVQLFSE